MRYNGKEVTEGFVTQVLFKLNEGLNDQFSYSRTEVKNVLQAAEEVFAEMEKETFKIGDDVRHKTKGAFGKGVVIDVSEDSKTVVVKFPEYNGKISAWEDAYVGHFKTYDLINLTYKEA